MRRAATIAALLAGVALALTWAVLSILRCEPEWDELMRQHHEGGR